MVPIRAHVPDAFPASGPTPAALLFPDIVQKERRSVSEPSSARYRRHRSTANSTASVNRNKAGA